MEIAKYLFLGPESNSSQAKSQGRLVTERPSDSGRTVAGQALQQSPHGCDASQTHLVPFQGFCFVECRCCQCTIRSP